MGSKVKPTESAVRFMAKMRDCRLQKPLEADSSGADVAGGYMLVDVNDDIVMGQGYACTLEEIYKYLFLEINKEGTMLCGKILLGNTNA